MLELKGPLFKSTLKYVKNKLGEEKFHQFLDSLTGEVKETLSKPILSSKFYPADHLVQLTRAFINFAGLDARATFKDIGATSADEGFSGIYRIFLKVGSPSLMIRSAKQVFRAYYNQGEMQMQNIGDKQAQIRIIGSGMEDECLCGRISGFIERTMYLSGGKNVGLDHTKCTASGDQFEEWIGTWE